MRDYGYSALIHYAEHLEGGHNLGGKEELTYITNSHPIVDKYEKLQSGIIKKPWNILAMAKCQKKKSVEEIAVDTKKTVEGSRERVTKKWHSPEYVEVRATAAVPPFHGKICVHVQGKSLRQHLDTEPLHLPVEHVMVTLRCN